MDQDERDLWAWMEDHVTLHGGIEFVYVVDGYEAQLTGNDGATVRAIAKGVTLRDAVVALRVLARHRGVATA